ncbi:Hypothetical predicted protein [Cloeon dipterum]|uniref:Uncharacterized protein n=1 Tax=Cloeon dipterum TaxID=197152 RepID=A0A8S1E0H5_9INSE|nr:Hypothetical predicted protein [Cloeon dipterum]
MDYLTSLQLVDMAKIRLRSLRRYQSLLQLATFSVAKNIDCYDAHVYDDTTDPKNPTVHLLASRLSPEMRDRILQELLKRFNRLKEEQENAANFDKVMKFLPLLLSTSTRKLDLTGLCSIRPNECNPNKSKKLVEQVLNWIADLAPNVEKLMFKCCLYVYEHGYFTEQEMNALAKLPYLKKLQACNIPTNWNQLLQLCRTLPNLQVLDFYTFWTTFKEDRQVDFEQAKKDLCHLRVLLCNSSSVDRLLKEHFPNLDFFFEPEEFRISFDEIPLVEEKDDSPPMNLRQFLNYGIHVAAENELHVKYPNITHLRISYHLCEGPSFDSLLQFTKLNTLVLQNVNSNLVEPFLIKLGKTLRFLSLLNELPAHGYSNVAEDCAEFMRFGCDFDDDHGGINRYQLPDGDHRIRIGFKRISELCPELEKLELCNVQVKDTWESYANEKFAKLRKLTWKSGLTWNWTPLMAFILTAAPSLQEAYIETVKFDEKDLEVLRSSISKREILQKLERLHINMPQMPCKDRSFRKFQCLLKEASVFLPKLDDLRFTVCGETYEDCDDGSLVDLLNAYRSSIGLNFE